LIGMTAFDAFRQTRSKKVFSPWSGNFIVPSQPFDADQALSTAVDRFTAELLLSESPLSTPPSTPSQTPLNSPPSSPLSSPPSSPTQSPSHRSFAGLPTTNNDELQLPASLYPSKVSKAKSKSTKKKTSVKKTNRTKVFSRKARNAKKNENLAKAGHHFYHERPKIHNKYFNMHATSEQSIQVDFDTSSASAATTGFVGTQRSFSQDTFALEEIVKSTGFEVVAWDGVTPTPIADLKGRIIVHLAGRPEGDDWLDTCRQAEGLMEEARTSLGWENEAEVHRRGAYH
ncbi:hypothetical protein H0H93_010804, partial [Arthromyces matolae]